MAAMDDDTGPSACRRGRGDDPCPPNAPARKKQKTPEVRAQALLQLGRLEGLASASVEPPRERPHATVAREFNVGVSTVRRWERQVEDGDGTGRRPTKHTHQFLARREAGEDALRSEMLKKTEWRRSASWQGRLARPSRRSAGSKSGFRSSTCPSSRGRG